MEEDDLYEILGVSSSASKAEIKKAYHKAALSSHPDKAAPEDREAAEVTFKSVSAAYEILSDDDTRAAYDTHGMAAFDRSHPGGPGGVDIDLEEMMAQMFGGGGGGFEGFAGMGGFPGMGGGARQPPGQRKRPKGQDEEQDYEVTLEELYKGKTTRFASTKNVVCGHCRGSGGKEKAKPVQCSVCRGQGMTQSAVSLGGGMMTMATNPCSNCAATGQTYASKDKCKKCKGARVLSTKKMLELYIPPGARDGEKVVLRGEADQQPNDAEAGDLVFTLREQEHAIFERKGHDLRATVTVTLKEALCGLDRVVLTHLDGRGIRTNSATRTLRPGQVLRVRGEGMPVKKSDHRGDLFLTINVAFPPDGFFDSLDSTTQGALQNALPSALPKDKQPPGAKAGEITDEVDVEDAKAEEFGGAAAEEEWEDDEDEGDGQPQCATQ